MTGAKEDRGIEQRHMRATTTTACGPEPLPSLRISRRIEGKKEPRDDQKTHRNGWDYNIRVQESSEPPLPSRTP